MVRKPVNPFAIALIALNLGAAGYELIKHNDWWLGIMYICYAIATLAIALKGAQ